MLMRAIQVSDSETIQIVHTDQRLARHADRTFQDVAIHLPALLLSNPSCADRFVLIEPTDEGDRVVVGVTTLSAPDAAGQQVAVTMYRDVSRRFDGSSINFGKGYALQTLDGIVLAQKSDATSAHEAANFAIRLIKPDPLGFSVRILQTPASDLSTLVGLANRAEIA